MTVQQACYTIRGAAHEQRGFADQVIDPLKVKERFLKNAADLDAAATVLEELNADKERIDWLVKHALDFEFNFKLNGATRKNYASGCVLRPVIDAAIKATA